MIDDYSGASSRAGALFEPLEHVRDRAAVLAVSLENLMSFGEAVTVEHQPHQHLLTIGALVAGVAPLRLPVAHDLPLKVGRGQIVEVNRLVKMEQLLLACGQFPFDLLPMWMQLVEIAIERILREGGKLRPQNVPHRCSGGANPAWHARRVDRSGGSTS